MRMCMYGNKGFRSDDMILHRRFSPLLPLGIGGGTTEVARVLLTRHVTLAVVVGWELVLVVGYR